MSVRDIINTIDVIITRLNQALKDSSAYINAMIMDHDKRFPEDRGSTFVRNLFTRVVENQDIYISQLISNLLYMKQSIKANPNNLSSIQQNAPIAIESLQHILSKTNKGLGMTAYGLDLRYHDIEAAIANYKSLLSQIEKQKTDVPVTYSGWEPIGTNASPGGRMWKKTQGIYYLLVQESMGKFYATVKDTKNMRVYSDATPYETAMAAMNAATSRALKLAHESSMRQQRRTTQEEYRPIYRGKQGRLF